MSVLCSEYQTAVQKSETRKGAAEQPGSLSTLGTQKVTSRLDIIGQVSRLVHRLRFRERE